MPVGAEGDRVAPVGSVTYVVCGQGATARLRTAGDSDAVVDGDFCAQWSAGCVGVGDPLATIAEVRLEKFADGSWGDTGHVCTRPTRPVVTAALVRERVVRLIPAAGLGLAPKGSSLVNIQTVMWVDAAGGQDLPVVRILGQRVVVHIRLDHVAYNFGDGVTDAVGPAGKAYDESGDPCRTRLCPNYYGHVYARHGRYAVSATVAWNASFSVAGGAAQPIPGTVAGPTSTATIVVREARAVLVPNP